MKALITGASSGIGRDIAKVLAGMGIDLIIVARRIDRLKELKEELKVHVEIISMDVSSSENCKLLYEHVKDKEVDIIVNNAGFGLFGAFSQTDLDKELSMIDTNIKAVHILTKLFIQNPHTKYILNVASSAAFMPGPLMAGYYATKSYVLRLTQAVSYELKKQNSPIHISALCPGPVHTEFNEVADVRFRMKGLNSMDVAKYAVVKMMEGQMVIIPGTMMKITKMLSKISPDRILLCGSYHFQKRKKG